MPARDLAVVTGALSHTGKHIARRLLEHGQRVRTLTGHPERENPFGDRIEVARLDLHNPEALIEALTGSATLYNTYWIRFERGAATFDRAVRNSVALLDAARRAGVRRVVHLSVTNPSPDSPLPYFRGKAQVEKAVKKSGLTYAIARPALIFGEGGILINNLAWLLRRSPVVPLFGSGEYRVRPIFVDDLADLCVAAGETAGNIVLDAVGPEVHTFGGLLRLIRKAVHSRTLILPLPPRLALLLSKSVGLLLGDVTVTRDEVRGLMWECLFTEGPATGPARLSEWLARNADSLGRTYINDLKRHYR